MPKTVLIQITKKLVKNTFLNKSGHEGQTSCKNTQHNVQGLVQPLAVKTHNAPYLVLPLAVKAHNTKYWI